MGRRTSFLVTVALVGTWLASAGAAQGGVEIIGARDRIAAEDIKGKVNVQRFKGLGEMNPAQLRETTIHPDTRRLVQLTVGPEDDADQILDMLLAKKRSPDRKVWLQEKGDMAEIQ